MREISCMARPIELRDSADYLVSAAHVGAMLDEVNVIFRQVGLHFSVGAPLRVVENDQWAQYGLLRRDCGNAIRNIMSGTGGVEVYFIPGADAETENARNEPLGDPDGISRNLKVCFSMDSWWRIISRAMRMNRRMCLCASGMRFSSSRVFCRTAAGRQTSSSRG